MSARPLRPYPLAVRHTDTLPRRYHLYREGRYPLPNDEQESDRETLKHILLKELIGGRIHLAPIGRHPQKIVEAGEPEMATGQWKVTKRTTTAYPSANGQLLTLTPSRRVVPQRAGNGDRLIPYPANMGAAEFEICRGRRRGRLDSRVRLRLYASSLCQLATPKCR